MSPTLLRVKQLPHAEGLPLPAYQSTDAAGFDLAAAIPDGPGLILTPGARMLVPTGLVFMLEAGFEAQVRPRSGLALKHGVTVLNAPGTIDADYRGEVGVILINHGSEPFPVTRGLRIAQCVIAEAPQARIEQATEVGQTMRGAGGFGSTGG